MTIANIKGLPLHEEEEDEDLCFNVGEDGEDSCIYGGAWWEGSCVTYIPIHVRSMKVKIMDMWRPVNNKEECLFLFYFAHNLAMEVILYGGPWIFDSHMLIIERVKLGVQIDNIPLFHVDFWVQVHNLLVGLMLEKVRRTMVNFIDTFVEYGKNNNSIFRHQ